MRYDARRELNDNRETALLYASPNVNAAYTSDCISATKWQGDYPVCAVCGKSRGPFAVHHEPPRSKGSLMLQTAMGLFVVKPTLLLLCRSCHADRHDNGELSFRWEFDTQDEEERFLSGEFFKAGYSEHDERFWERGRLVVTHRGEEREVRR